MIAPPRPGRPPTGTVAIEGGQWGGVDGAAFFLALVVAFLAIVLQTTWRALHLDRELLFQSMLVVSVVLIGSGPPSSSEPCWGCCSPSSTRVS